MQIKNSFDSESLKKIGKGLLIAATGGAAIAILDYIGTIDTGLLEPMVVTLIPTLTNIVKEWMKGS